MPSLEEHFETIL